eukprot:574197-Hanusia_phi.AAC.1
MLLNRGPGSDCQKPLNLRRLLKSSDKGSFVSEFTCPPAAGPIGQLASLRRDSARPGTCAGRGHSASVSVRRSRARPGPATAVYVDRGCLEIQKILSVRSDGITGIRKS